jgi:DNA-binding transcriptional ArsR family regulator
MEEPVTIVDKDILKVLAVDTRIEIMKQLQQGSRTPSDISKRLHKRDSTIVEHLDALVKAGLVKKVEQPGKKWVFYTLTEKGYGVMSSKSRRLIILLGTSVLALAGGFMSLGTYASQSRGEFASGPFAATEAISKAADATATIATSAPPAYLYLSIALLAGGAIGMGFFMMQKRGRI